MKLKLTLKQIRNAALVAGAAALLPVSAQAMLTDHDKTSTEAHTGAVRSATADHRALSFRFGTYSGIGANGAERENKQPEGGAAGADASPQYDVYKRLP